MTYLLIGVKVLYGLLSLTLITIVLFQKGKTAGLSGAISGAGDTYWGKNKARDMDGKLNNWTVAIAVSFIVGAILIQVLEKLV